jgi:hypothetical protein
VTLVEMIDRLRSAGEPAVLTQMTEAGMAIGLPTGGPPVWTLVPIDDESRARCCDFIRGEAQRLRAGGRIQPWQDGGRHRDGRPRSVGPSQVHR